MSSTATRRFKRKVERDKKKGKAMTYTNPYGETELNIPSREEVEEYISNKTKELRMTDPFDNLDEFFINPVTPVIKRSNYPDTPDGQLAYELTSWNKTKN
jgi:hypothetical protein